MSPVLEPADLAARASALDPSRSYIVQAPAGSGKTELLIQRYLVLLSIADEPEEIAAITFTRKAAAEMKNRVIAALEEARDSHADIEALPAHERLTRRHALAALARERARGWDLRYNASRLRIQTIDALCASLTRQMPVLSAFGAQPESVDDARPLFREAARATLELLDAEDERANDLALLLEHLDNNIAAAESLITAMLARRDHWLRNLAGGGDRQALESALEAVRDAARTRAASLVPSHLHTDLLGLLDYASLNLEHEGRESPIRACWHLKSMPACDESGHDAWLGVAELLLTREGEWRKFGGLTVALGFPAGEDKAGKAMAKAWKDRLSNLIAGLGESALRGALHDLRRLPSACYDERQWQVLGAILRLMPVAVAQLRLVFAERGQADFVEIAQRALLCLGNAEAPTDLMLALDYRIHHLLVDEFQDTSLTQFALLEALTSGWQMDEGPVGAQSARTLFLVGDPMQSIYRFREAEVGLFLKAKREGMSGIALTPLTLTANFRSQAGIVEWVNRSFEKILPAEDNIATGSVRYTASVAVHESLPAPVRVHANFDGDPAAEAAQVAALVAEARQRDPEGSIAILVRNRGHLRDIVPALRNAGLAFRAIEIEALGHRQAVQDMYALTRAILHLDDRAAWLAILRAPWCGLTLADLLILTGGESTATVSNNDNVKDLFGEIAGGQTVPADIDIKNELKTVWESVADPLSAQWLSADGGKRLARFRAALETAVNHPLRGKLRERVESAWLSLGGPACIAEDTDLEDIDIYLDCLARYEEAGEIADVAAFEQAVEGLYALPDMHADERLQIMTIHKAKGLEFDTVIVPSLGAGSGRDERGLLAWMEMPSLETPQSLAGIHSSGARLLIAPINASGSDNEPTYEYLRQLDRIKGRFEEARLLYVAATRARKHLHLAGATARDRDGGARAPVSGSLLERLWPAVAGEFHAQAQDARHAAGVPPLSAPAVAPPAHRSVELVRLAADWRAPGMPPAVYWSQPPLEESGVQALEFSWVGEVARHVGSVVHRWMQRMAEDALQDWDGERIDRLRDAFGNELASRGVEAAQCDAAVDRVVAALTQTLGDARGRWLLGAQKVARNEYRLGTYAQGERREWVIDRTFIDEQGRRWIVDYKTSSHEGSDVAAFLDREKNRYAPQLERYARLLADPQLGASGPIHLGLYFPLLSAWREWVAGDTQQKAG
jgi:ATP-dependent helicase/nuclease subunit A